MDNERLFYLVAFIQGDIEAAIKAAVGEAIEKGVRHTAALEAITQEASLNVNQILLRAKREFGIGGLEAETPLDEKTREGLAQEIEAIDASYSLPAIHEMLEERLGIPFVQEVRGLLEAELGKPAENLEAVQRELGKVLEGAYNHAQSAIAEPDLLRVVEEDLDQLRAYYLDPDFLRARLG